MSGMKIFSEDDLDRSWIRDGACIEVDTDFMFPTSRKHPELSDPAKAVCAGCPVREVCLEYALATREPDGVWGGMTPEERNLEIRRRVKRKRDKKIPYSVQRDWVAEPYADKRRR